MAGHGFCDIARCPGRDVRVPSEMCRRADIDATHALRSVSTQPGGVAGSSHNRIPPRLGKNPVARFAAAILLPLL
jgi:hypothetical protein